MASYIHKHGFPAATDVEEAKEAAKAFALEEAADLGIGGTVLSVDIIRTPAHEEAGEFLVRVLVGDPTPDEESASPQPVARAGDVERQQLLARLAELDART